MKIVLKPEFAQQLRQVIAETRKVLEENKTYRKTLFKQIGELKMSIRSGERLSSAVVTNLLDNSGYVRSVITEKQRQLRHMREQLVSAEIFREIELAKFRILHEQLDRFNVPLNPSAPRRRRN